ncbi:MAG: ABC transporter permease, partial [Halobacteriovoraceae bacterium]|nr:ABC transporter permease [Halobacteriovoraceae bacterium]
MSKLPIFSLFKVIFDNRSAFRFLAGTIASCSFSVAVILCTIGLMDGFDFTLKKALSHSNGDIKISGHDDFFLVDNKTKKSFIKENLLASSFLLQIEAFALVNEESKGVLLKGIEKKSFSIVTGLDVSTLDNGIIIGKQFQKLYNLKIGDSVVVAFASGSAKDQGSATLKEFFVEGIVRHGVYEKDLRFIYIDKTTLSKILGYKTDISNLGFIKIQDFSNINQVIKNLNSEFSDRFVFRPYWSEFEVLLDAVKIEKLSISIVLQLIVIVAVLNVVGFIVFVLETKALDFFMLRAFGLSFYMIQKFWYLLLFF